MAASCHLSCAELTVEERNLVSVGYKNAIGAKRASWRILFSIEDKEEGKGHELNVKRIKDYRMRVEHDISNVCYNILSLRDKHLLPSSTTGESTVLYYKMACYLAHKALGEATAELDNLNEESYKDRALIMQLLRENLTLWAPDLDDGGNIA